MVANAMPFQQPTQFQQSMQYQQQQRRPRRDGGRGGRGGNWQQQAWGQMQQQPNTYQPNTSFNGSQSGGGGNPPTQHNPYRRYENDGFCGTYGGHVHDGHNSQTYTKPGPNHNPHAPRNNRMNTTDMGMHKTTMPSRSGRQADHRPQPRAGQAYLAWRAQGFPGSLNHFKKYNRDNNQQDRDEVLGLWEFSRGNAHPSRGGRRPSMHRRYPINSV